ncbi:MAG TPA: class I SAM-dependent methyltransferase, partial [Solirubrobacterales bacterium]|nr:class I SAM-dependent methyltransferase [Solirubrobacterales bacterium]
MTEVPALTPLATAVLHVGDPERILQVQCGEGDGALFLAREFPRASVRGVDADEAAIRRAAARVGLDPEGRVAFKVGGPRKLPFPDDLFDLVALLDAPPPPREVARVLRPGGY